MLRLFFYFFCFNVDDSLYCEKSVRFNDDFSLEFSDCWRRSWDGLRVFEGGLWVFFALALYVALDDLICL